MIICPNCKIEYDAEKSHACEQMVDPYPIPNMPPYAQSPIQFQVVHPEWGVDVKVSNDNTKGEKRVTVHVRSDGDAKAARKLADELYKDTLGS